MRFILDPCFIMITIAILDKFNFYHFNTNPVVVDIAHKISSSRSEFSFNSTNSSWSYVPAGDLHFIVNKQYCIETAGKPVDFPKVLRVVIVHNYVDISARICVSKLVFSFCIVLNFHYRSIWLKANNDKPNTYSVK